MFCYCHLALAINAVIGFFTEYRAIRSMESLQKLSSTTTKVRRNGQFQEILAEELVPGDIVVLEIGFLFSLGFLGRRSRTILFLTVITTGLLFFLLIFTRNKYGLVFFSLKF